MSCVRHFGPDKARDVARRTVEGPHPYVTGFGMGGDEAGFPPGAFADAFAIAREAGLGLTVHAGEWAGPESVRGGPRARRQPDRPRRPRQRGSRARARTRRAGHGARGMPHLQRRARPLPELRGAPAARPARRRGARDARLRRPAVLGRVDRRRVRGRRRAAWASTRRPCARSRGPRSVRPSWRRMSGSGCSSLV